MKGNILQDRAIIGGLLAILGIGGISFIGILIVRDGFDIIPVSSQIGLLEIVGGSVVMILGFLTAFIGLRLWKRAKNNGLPNSDILGEEIDEED